LVRLSQLGTSRQLAVGRDSAAFTNSEPSEWPTLRRSRNCFGPAPPSSRSTVPASRAATKRSGRARARTAGSRLNRSRPRGDRFPVLSGSDAPGHEMAGFVPDQRRVRGQSGRLLRFPGQPPIVTIGQLCAPVGREDAEPRRPRAALHSGGIRASWIGPSSAASTQPGQGSGQARLWPRLRLRCRPEAACTQLS
jgi:hypothetical protein